MKVGDMARSALGGVGSNKLRAGLTTLGIIIGVASVIAMLALGNGARAAVDANFRYLGADTVQIRVKQELDQGEMVPVGKILSYEDGLLLTREVGAVRRVDMSVSRSGKVRRGRVVLDMVISGVTTNQLSSFSSQNQVQPTEWPEGVRLRADSFIGAGRFFVPAEVLGNAGVCVLGHDTALDLFQGDDPLDETVWVSRQRCIVIGILAELEVIDPRLRNRMRPNDSIYLPISTAVQNLYKNEPSVQIIARVVDESRMNEAKQRIAAYLRQRHGIEQDQDDVWPDDFELVTRRDILGAQQDAARTFSLLLAAMAVVALVVGGIGIMNVMLVSVTERTREIGVRRAVGALRRDIVAQFLLEAVLMSAGGGLLGVAVGILSIPLAASLNRGIALLAPSSIPLAFAIALLTGIVFGLYPAFRASRLNPIEALRYE